MEEWVPQPEAVEAACRSLMPGYPVGLSVPQAMAFAKQVRAALMAAHAAETEPRTNVVPLRNPQ